MGKVMPIRRKGTGGPPTAGAHIDSASYALLVETLVGFLELRIAEGDAGRAYAVDEEDLFTILRPKLVYPDGAVLDISIA